MNTYPSFRVTLPCLSLVAALLSPAVTSAAGGDPVANDVRAVWVTRWDYVSAYDIRTIVSNCASLGMNRIYFQVRGQADAYYRSSLEPWGESLGGDPARGGDPGFDPLEIALRAARPAGIELHAWINVLPGWKGSTAPRSKKHVVHAHPEWFLKDVKGRRPLCDGERYTLLNPCLPEVRDHLERVVSEIVEGYEVDGVQLDYIRFLRRNLNRGEDVPFDSPTLARFRDLHGGFPARFPREWDAFRIECMDRLLEGLARAARRARPALIISVAAIKDLASAREDLFQDAPRWLRRGWIDEICPMIYTTSQRRFADCLEIWRREVPARQLVAGIGLYRLSRESQITGQLDVVQRSGVAGYALFSYPACFLSRSPHSSRDPAAAERRALARKLLRER